MNDFKRKTREFIDSERFSSSVVTALVIAVVMVFNALLFTVVEMFGLVFYYDKPFDYSITGSSDELFDEAIKANKKVKIYFCMSESELKAHSTGGEVYVTAKKFEEKYPEFIELDYLNIITKQDKDGNFVDLNKYLEKDTTVSADSSETEKDETKYLPIYNSSVIFECGDNYKVITDNYTSTGFSPFYTMDSSRYITSYNGEEVMAAMISWVTVDEHKTAYFTQRHGEQVDTGFANLLLCAGYNIDTVDLRKNSVPEDAGLLIISNPTSDFEASKDGSVYTEMDKIREYMERDGGGNLYVTLDPYVKTLTVLEDFLIEYGIAFSTSVDHKGNTIKNIVKDNTDAITSDGFTLVCNFAKGEVAESIKGRVSDDDDGVLVRDIAALELSGNAKPLLTSSPSSSLEAGGKTVSSSGSYNVCAYSDKTNASGKVSKVFVVPSIYIAVSDTLNSDGYYNKDFLYSTIESLFWDKPMPYGCSSISYSSQILRNLTMGTARIYTVAVMLIPTSIAVVGAVVLIKRKHR